MIQIPNSNVLALLSGGLDSFLVSYLLHRENQKKSQQGEEGILLLHINYGQLASKQEYNAVKEQATFLGLNDNLIYVDIGNVGSFVSSGLTDSDETSNFLPARNLLLLTIASQIASSKDIDTVAIGINRSIRSYSDPSRAY